MKEKRWTNISSTAGAKKNILNVKRVTKFHVHIKSIWKSHTYIGKRR